MALKVSIKERNAFEQGYRHAVNEMLALISRRKILACECRRKLLEELDTHFRRQLESFLEELNDG